MVRKFYEIDDDDDWTIAEVQAEAYLTLPLLYAPISSDPGPRAALFSVSSVLDPSVLVGPTDAQLEQFKTAANILKLHAHSSDEDETEFEDKHRIPETATSDGESGSRGSEDGDDDGNGAEDDGAGNDDTENCSVESDGLNSYGPDSDASNSNEAALQGQQTAGNIGSDIKTDGVTPEPATVSVEGNLRVGVDLEKEEEKKEETWPQLMILGCGKLEVEDFGYY